MAPTNNSIICGSVRTLSIHSLRPLIALAQTALAYEAGYERTCCVVSVALHLGHLSWLHFFHLFIQWPTPIIPTQT